MRGWLPPEEGFTLIELIIGISMLVLLIGVVAAAAILGFRTTDESARQIDEAAWGRIAADWFTSDVQAADTVRSGSDACGPVDGAVLLRGFDRPDGPLPPFPTTTTTTLIPPEPPTTTTTTIPTTTTTTVVVSHHVDWWLSGSGSVLRAPCTVETILPPPDPGPSDPPAPSSEVVARGLESASIDCTSASCTLEWVASLSDDAPNRSLEDRTYTLTVARRVR